MEKTNEAFVPENGTPKNIANRDSAVAIDDVAHVIPQKPGLERNFSVQGATVSFHNLCYTAQVPPQNGKPCSQRVSKEILHSVR